MERLKVLLYTILHWKSLIWESCGLQLPKIGDGQRELRGGQPWKAGVLVWQWVPIQTWVPPPPPRDPTSHVWVEYEPPYIKVTPVATTHLRQADHSVGLLQGAIRPRRPGATTHCRVGRVGESAQNMALDL